MKIRTATLLCSLAFGPMLAACDRSSDLAPADLVLTNGYVYTVDEARSVAQAVAVSGNSIVFVGSNDGANAFVGEQTEVRDLQGAMLMPGLHDMHIHALGIVEPDMCDLDSTALSLEQLVPVLRGCLEKYAPAEGEWLIVVQWAFSRGNQPSESLPNMRAALDAVSVEHPIFLWGDDGHHGAANSAALALAKNADGDVVGISAATLANEFAAFKPMFGVDANSEPNGGVNEDARMLIRPNFFEDMLGMGGAPDEVMPQVAAKLAANGITSIQDAIVEENTLASYDWLEDSGRMTFRLKAALAEPESENIDDFDAHFAKLKLLRDQHVSSSLIRADAVKLFADGVLEGNPLTKPPTLPVAATLQNFKQPIFGGSIDDGTFGITGYVDQGRDTCKAVQADPRNYEDAVRVSAFEAEYGFFPQQCIPSSGVLEHEEAFIRAYIRKATEAGFNVHVHALADKAVRVAVDEFGKVKKLADEKNLTQSLAHVQIAHPDDQKRIGELGVSVVFTFVWATPGVQYEMMVEPFIDEVSGIEDLYSLDNYYMKNVYPAKSIQGFGGVLVNGSDAPVGSRDPMPFVSLQQAVYRSDGEHVMTGEERIDVHSAIAAFTINGARLFGHADKLGSIETGKIADLIAIDQNIVGLADSGEPQRIADTKVLFTVFDGKVVYEQTDED
jgi:predicted amidohydrolase YtcJ